MSKFIDSLTDYNKHRIFQHLSMLAKNRFRWENLPPGFESRHIEHYLFNHGQVAFFEHDTLGLLCLPCSKVGMNIHGDETSIIVQGVNFHDQLTNNYVKCLSNDNAFPLVHHIMHYAKLLDLVEDISIKNLEQQRTPYIFPTTTENEKSMKNMYKKIKDGALAIFVDKKLSNGGDMGVQAINTQVPYLLTDLRLDKKEIESELLTLLGLNNSSSQKKERLLVDEVNVNNGHILMNLDTEFKNRQKACEEVNKLFGTNIKVVKTMDKLEQNFWGGETE